MSAPINPDIEYKARAFCFADCSKGLHLDPEAGCCSVCSSPDQCQGWRSYSSEARAALSTQESSAALAGDGKEARL